MSERRGSVTHLGRWCEAHRVTYAALSERCSIPKSVLVLIVTGERIPCTTHVLALMRETKLSFEDLVLGSQKAVEAASKRGMMSRKGVMR